MEEGVPPLRARIAERLGHSGPTVSQTVARMERDGLLVVADDRRLELTGDGLAHARRVMRKHRLAERLLTDVIGLDWPLAHTEACRWEHVMSEQVEQRLAQLLPPPYLDPYGNPVPGLDELGAAQAQQATASLTPLDQWTRGRAVLMRIAETAQTDVGLLARLREAQIAPGIEVTVTQTPSLVTIGVPGAQSVLDIPDDLAKHLFVRAA
jgi:DtxR family Mn-dependent transcriptional regulator